MPGKGATGKIENTLCDGHWRVDLCMPDLNYTEFKPDKLLNPRIWMRGGF